MLSRRSLLLAPAVVAAASLMPVRSVLRFDPLVRGVCWQSWPKGAPRPYYHNLGTRTMVEGKAPLSRFQPWVDYWIAREPAAAWEIIW